MTENLSRTESRPDWLEVAAVLTPGLVRLIADFALPYLTYNDLVLFAALILVTVLEGLRRIRQLPLTPWFWPMWILVLQGFWWIIQRFTQELIWLADVYPRSMVSYFLLPSAAIEIAILCLILWHVIRKQTTRVWLVLAALICAVMGIVLLTGAEPWLRSCPGMLFRLAHLPCIMREYLRTPSYALFALSVVLAPLAASLAARQRHGASAGLGLLASVVVWRDVLYLPFQLYGGTWLAAFRQEGPCNAFTSATAEPQRILQLLSPWIDKLAPGNICPTLSVGVESLSHLGILVFMLLLPAGMLLFRLEKWRMRWLMAGSFAGVAMICYLCLHLLILTQDILMITPFSYMMVALMGLVLWLPFLAFTVSSSAGQR